MDDQIKPPHTPTAPESSSEVLSELHDKRIDEMAADYAKPPSPRAAAPLSPPSAPANVTPIIPGMPLGGPRLDPMSQVLQSLGMNFDHLTHERDSPKGRAWELLCACARRAPVDEETVRHALKLSLHFEDEWRKHEAIAAGARAVAQAEQKKGDRS